MIIQERESLGAAVSLLEGRQLLEEEELCLNIRGRAEHCDRCTTACHSGALTLTPDALEVDRDKCTGCGACVPTCPAGALRLSGFSPERFLAALTGDAGVHLHCSESKDSGGGVVIPCFKILDERLVAAARADGVESLVLHGLERCTECRHGGAAQEVAITRQRLAGLLGESAVNLVPSTDADAAAGSRSERQRQDQPRINRRDFLRFSAIHVAEGVARWVIPTNEDDGASDLPFFQGDPDAIRQPHPYQSLLAERVSDVPWQETAMLPWRKRTLEEHCTACLACGQRCPTGALLAMEDSKSRRVSFEQALCTDCGLCEALCPVDAVQANQVYRVDEVEASRSVVMMRKMVPCDYCGTLFLPECSESRTCPICANEQDLDDEWLAMLEG